MLSTNVCREVEDKNTTDLVYSISNIFFPQTLYVLFSDSLLLPLMTDLSFISCLGGKLLKFLGLSLSPSCLGLLDGSFILILATCL